MRKIILDEPTYKRVKKKKKCIYISQENIVEDIDKNVIISNGTKEKKAKIKNKYEIDNFDALKNKLGKNSKYIRPLDIKYNDNKIYVIEFKHSLKLFRKILLLIFVLGLLYLFKVNLSRYLNNRLIDKVNKIKEDEISYAIVEINPKILIELKRNKVNNYACLNMDCMDIFGNISIKDKEINKVIDILYNTAIDKEIDVSKGVKVLSVNEKIKQEINNIPYVTYEIINKDTENKYKEEVINNQEIKNSSIKQSYNEELLKAYKKDIGYGGNYSCEINNDELECYITDRLLKKIGYEQKSSLDIFTILDGYQGLMEVCDKFGIPYQSTGVEGGELLGIDKVYLNKMYISGYYRKVGNFSYNDFSCNGCISINDTDMGQAMMNGNHYYLLPLNKLNLVNGTYKQNDIIIFGS